MLVMIGVAWMVVLPALVVVVLWRGLPGRAVADRTLTNVVEEIAVFATAELSQPDCSTHPATGRGYWPRRLNT